MGYDNNLNCQYKILPPSSMDFVTIDFEEPFQLEAGKLSFLEKDCQIVLGENS